LTLQVPDHPGYEDIVSHVRVFHQDEGVTAQLLVEDTLYVSFDPDPQQAFDGLLDLIKHLFLPQHS